MADSSDLIKFKEAVALATSSSPFNTSSIRNQLITASQNTTSGSNPPSNSSGINLPNWFVITNADNSNPNTVLINGDLISNNIGANNLITKNATIDSISGITAIFNNAQIDSISGVTGIINNLKSTNAQIDSISGTTAIFSHSRIESLISPTIASETATINNLRVTNGITAANLSASNLSAENLSANYINLQPKISSEPDPSSSNGTLWIKQGNVDGATTFILMLDSNVIGSGSSSGTINVRPETWANFPAISDVNLANYNITNGGTGTFNKIYASSNIHTNNLNTYNETNISVNNSLDLKNNSIIGATAVEVATVKITNIDNLSGNTNDKISIKKSVHFEGDNTITGTKIVSKLVQDKTNYSIELQNSTDGTISEITTGLSHYTSGLTVGVQRYAGATATTTFQDPLSLTTNTIVSNSDIIPNRDSFFNDSGLNLGNEKAWWNKAYIRDLHISPYTIRVIGDDGKEMAISYDVNTGSSSITTSDFTVQSVTTSASFPGQIDASLLPFTGLTFASKINIADYIASTGNNSMLDQMYSLIYTMNYTVVTAPYPRPLYIVNYPIVQLINNIAGAYYVVDNTPNNITVKLPKIRATTYLNVPDKTSSDTLRSTFTVISEELAQISNGDILILVSNFQPNTADPTKFDIIFGWQEVAFQVPINGVSNQNIIDNSITSNKLADGSVTNPKLAANAVTTSKISDFSITSAKIQNNAVTTAKIADFSIVSSKIVDGAVTTNKFADGVITTAKLADNSIITQKIADLNITTAKLANQSITTAKISDLNVTSGKLADQSVINSKISTNAISSDKIQNSAVSLNKLSQDVIDYINSTVTSGPTGAQGLAGPTGVQGPQGIRGQDGIIGRDGTEGPTGPQGERGQDGIIGIDGDTGPTGPRGLDGLIGPTGPGGTVGATGQYFSNYLYWDDTANKWVNGGVNGNIKLGHNSGEDQGTFSIAMGYFAGFTGQKASAIGIGNLAGNQCQGNNSIALGKWAGQYNQGMTGGSSLAIGTEAGWMNQDMYTVAMGYRAGWQNQTVHSVAIGTNAGDTNQSGSSIAIGQDAGRNFQSSASVAVGWQAGQDNQSSGNVAIGVAAGKTGQKSRGVAIGRFAGNDNQGMYSVAIGNSAGHTQQPDRSICVNASEYMINPEQTGACYIFPVRQDDTVDTNVVSYNSETAELVYRPIDAMPVQVFNVSNSLTSAATPVIYDKVSVLSTKWDFNQNYIIDITVPTGYSGPTNIKLAKINKDNTIGNEILIGFITPGTTQSITLSYMQFEYGTGINKILDGDEIALYSYTNNTKNIIASNSWRMIKKQSNNIGNGTNTLSVNSINWTTGEVNFTVTEEFSVDNNKFLTLYNISKANEYQRKLIKIKSINRLTGEVIYDSSEVLNINVLKNNEYDGTSFISGVGTDFSIIIPSINIENAQIGDSLVFALASDITNEVSNIMIMEETTAYLSNAYSIFATAHINDFPVNQGLIIPPGTYTYTFGATMTTGGLYGDIYDFRISTLPFTNPNFYINLNTSTSISKQYTKVKPISITGYNRETGIITYDSIESFTGIFLKNGVSLDIYFTTNVGTDLTFYIPEYVIGDKITIANLDLGVILASNEYNVYPIVTDDSIYPIKITNINRSTGEITYNATQNMTLRFVRNNQFDGTPFRSGVGVGLVYNAFNINPTWSQDGQDIWFSSSTTDILLKTSNTVTLFNNSGLNLFLGNNSIKYDINGTDNPTLTLIKGFTYHFIVNSPGNPIWIKNFQQTGITSAYNDGVTNNGISLGTLIFRVPYDAPNTLYYISQNSSLFTGLINIVDINNLGSGGGSTSGNINQQILNVLENKVQILETYIEILSTTYAIRDTNNNVLSLSDIRNQILSGGNYDVLGILEKKIEVLQAYLNIFTQTYVIKDNNNNSIDLGYIQQILIP